LKELRVRGISAEIYPESGAKMKKQLSYADAKKIPFVVMAGENEIKENQLALKNMVTGEQKKVATVELVATLSSI
jgi:histidyl-tRNA synthetase